MSGVLNLVKEKANLAPRARIELATLRLTTGECKTLNALFGVAYDREHLESRPSVGQLLGNLLKTGNALGIRTRPPNYKVPCNQGVAAAHQIQLLILLTAGT